MASAFTFLWCVARNGYRWADEKTASGPRRVLVEVDAGDGRYLTRSYEPLPDCPALFRHFADTETTESGILGFANQYGPLGFQAAHDGFSPAAEPFKSWEAQILEVRRAVELYDALRTDVKGLERLIRWQSDERGVVSVCYTGTPNDEETIASSRAHVDIFEAFPKGDRIIPARWFLQSLVHRNMAGLVELRLLHDRAWQPGLLGVPRNLLGALWLQLAEAYAGKELRQCADCKEWFAVRGRGPRTRSDVQFCTVACRHRAYRRRQEQARRLHAKGKTVKQIVAATGSDVKTVKGWIKSSKAK